MLHQSHASYIDLLPALPHARPKGKVRGLCARKGFIVDIQWMSYGPVKTRIHATNGGVCCVRMDGEVDVLCDGETVTKQALDLPGIEFKTQAGKDYVIRRRNN